jgi:ubiquinone/menaquinone biosynthesis C-methylase UbiE
MTARDGAATTVGRFFSFAAPIYDFSYLQRWVYRPAQDEMIALLEAHNCRRIADVGCGTGILADRIDRELDPEEIYGVDMAEGMLAQAKARTSQVTWMTGPAENLPFADGSLDAVVTTTAFHFFDQPAALREFHRVLAPGGFASVATLSPPQHLPLQGLIADRFNVGPHHPRPDDMRALFDDAGFIVDTQRRVNRPAWTRFITDVITVGSKPAHPG